VHWAAPRCAVSGRWSMAFRPWSEAPDAGDAWFIGLCRAIAQGSHPPYHRVSPLLQLTAGLGRTVQRVSAMKPVALPALVALSGAPRRRKRPRDSDPSTSSSPKRPSLDLTASLVDGKQLLAGRYRVSRLVARGGFSSLFEAVDDLHPEHRRVAVKVMQAQHSAIGAQEASLLVMAHRSQRAGATFSLDVGAAAGVMVLLDRFVFHQHSCLVFPLYGPSLHDALQLDPRVPMTSIRAMASRLATSLAHLRVQRMIHADVKPQNLLLPLRDPAIPPPLGELTLADLGNALTPSTMSLYFDKFEVQSVGYRAPEVSVGIPFGPAIDVWSVGVLVLEVASRRRFVPSDNRFAALDAVVSLLGPPDPPSFRTGRYWGEWRSSRKQGVAWSQRRRMTSIRAFLDRSGEGVEECVSFLERCLRWDPLTRATPLDMLLHPFVARFSAAPMLVQQLLRPPRSDEIDVDRKSIPVVLHRPTSYRPTSLLSAGVASPIARAEIFSDETDDEDAGD
jgi:serine/threonine protein kinase